jgi:hypothetical protein
VFFHGHFHSYLSLLSGASLTGFAVSKARKERAAWETGWVHEFPAGRQIRYNTDAADKSQAILDPMLLSSLKSASCNSELIEDSHLSSKHRFSPYCPCPAIFPFSGQKDRTRTMNKEVRMGDSRMHQPYYSFSQFAHLKLA